MSEQPTVILVNPSRGTLLFDRALLQSPHWSVRATTRGTDAWRLTRELAPRVVVFGFDLDDLVAPELCRLIRDNHRTRRVSLMFIGERAEPQQVDICMAAGCNELVYRPLHRAELEMKIQRLLAIPPRRVLKTLTRIEVVEAEASSTILGHSVNLSATGMLLQVDEKLPPAARLMLQFFLEDPVLPIRVRSEVVRAEFTGGTPRYGVRFMDLPNEQRSRIDTFVRQIPGGAA